MTIDLFAAVERGSLAKVKEALSTGNYDVNEIRKPSGVDATPLLLAAANASLAIVKLLLKQPDINVNLPNQSNRVQYASTPLHRASNKGHTEIVRLLLTHPDIDVNAIIELGGRSTAIETATMENRAPVVELLWNRVDDMGRENAMNHALNNSKYELIAKAIEMGSDFEISRIEKGFHEIMRYLPLNAMVRVLMKDLPVEIINNEVQPRRNHYNIWSTFISADLRTDYSVSKAAILKELFKNSFFQGVHRDALYRHLVYTKDQFHRNALDISDKDTRDFLQRLFYFLNRYEISDNPPIHISPTSVVLEAYDHGICHELFLIHSNEQGLLDAQGFSKCNITLGRLSINSMANKKNFSDNESLLKEFEHRVQDIGYMNEKQYEKFCELHFGNKFKVAMKFMKNKQDQIRERITRKDLDSSIVLHLLPALPDEEFEKEVENLYIHGGYGGEIYATNLSEYPNVLVMPAADRSLEDIYLKERASSNHICAMLYEIVLCLFKLHENGYIHGDLKKLNIVRLGHKLILIDLDAAIKIGNYIGLKYSSGILPPEMFYKLKNKNEKKQYELYWKQDMELYERIWDKIRPQKGYVVRTYRIEDGGIGLPYELIKASPSIDAWAIGCLMLQMWTGIELVSTDINQDVSPDRIEQAATWNNNKLIWRIKSHHLETDAEDLLLKLLVVQCNTCDTCPKRMELKDILKHSYFKRPLPSRNILI